MEKEQIIIAKLLGLEGDKNVDWAEIYFEIGRLQERANKNNSWTPPYYPNYPNVQPLTHTEPYQPYHLHGSVKCYDNPCVVVLI